MAKSRAPAIPEGMENDGGDAQEAMRAAMRSTPPFAARKVARGDIPSLK